MGATNPRSGPHYGWLSRGTQACFFLLCGLFVWTILWHASWWSGTGGWMVGLDGGSVQLKRQACGDNFIHGLFIDRGSSGFTMATFLPWLRADSWMWEFWLPLWVPMLIVGLPSVRHMRARARDRALLAKGACVGCGYDLGGLVAPKCPECGAAAA